MEGTQVNVYIDHPKRDASEPLCAEVLGIKKTRVTLKVQGEWQKKDVSSIEIVRGDEHINAIQDHLRYGHKIMLTNPSNWWHPFMSPIVDMAISPAQIATLSDVSEYKKASQLRQKRPSGWNARRWGAYKRGYAKKRSESKQQLENDASNPRYRSLNDAQLLMANSTAKINICEGYPGAAKTTTLAATVFTRFRTLMTQPSGWILCLSNTNSSALAMQSKVAGYSSLKPFLHHGYSEMYHAFHIEDFRDAVQYKVTKNKPLGQETHGILVCTIGSLRRIFKKYPELGPRVFDVCTDESGQVYKLDAIFFLANVPNLRRWYIFGDSRQLAYVTKLVKKGESSASIMTTVKDFRCVGDASFTPFTVKLVLQYRMTKVLCAVHAPIFYDYPIATFRTDRPNPERSGYLIDIIQNFHGTSDVSYVEHEANRAITIYEDLVRLDLQDTRGNPYTFCILTPYVDCMEVIQRKARDAKIRRGDLEISTIDRIQGKEYNAVIIASGRCSCTDLNRDPYRINVAMSRAKDLVVLICTSQFAAGTDGTHLWPWGQFIALSTPYALGDLDTNEAIFYNRYSGRGTVSSSSSASSSSSSPHTASTSFICSSSSSSATVAHLGRRPNRAQVVARAVLLDDERIEDLVHDLVKRKVLCKTLILRPQYWNVKEHSKPLFWGMTTCGADEFKRILQVFAEHVNYGSRNDSVRDILGLSRDAPVTAAMEQSVRDMYSVHEKRSKSKQKRRR